MELITILLIIVAILVICSGIAVFAGASRETRLQSFWFLIATIGGACWSLSVGCFLRLSTSSANLAQFLVLLIYASPLIMLWGLTAHLAWPLKKVGKPLTLLLFLTTAVLVTVLIVNPSLLYSSITISKNGNLIENTKQTYTYIYFGYALFLTALACIFALINSRKARNRRLRKGYRPFFCGLVITGIISLTFNFILPFFQPASFRLGSFTADNLLWVGPLSLSIVIILYYYSILKYRLLDLSSAWLKILSYLILMCSVIIIYMVAFYLITVALFKIKEPSGEIIAINFLLITILIFLLPIINEVNAHIRSAVSSSQINLTYVVRKLNRLAAQNVDLYDLAIFLAGHLHFQYIGLSVNHILYDSDEKIDIDPEGLEKLSKLKTKDNSIWQEIDDSAKEILEPLNIYAIAELKNGQGEPFGQILVGKPLGKKKLERRDLIQLEMIINLVAVVIDSQKHLAAKKPRFRRSKAEEGEKA